MRFCLVAVLLLCGFWVWADDFSDGKAAFSRQDWGGAVQLLGQYARTHESSSDAPQAAFLRGVALYQTGDYRASLDAFQKLGRTWPQSDVRQRLPYWTGTAALAAGQNALAESQLQLQAQFPDQEPYATRALLNLALAQAAQGKDAAAEQTIKSFLDKSNEPVLRAQGYVVWGDLSKKAGQWDSAVEHFRQSSAAQPSSRWDLAARTEQVDLLSQLLRWKDAKNSLSEARKVFPRELDRWDSRELVIDKALQDWPNLAATLESRWSRTQDAGQKQRDASNRAWVAEQQTLDSLPWWDRASAGPDLLLAKAALLRAATIREQQNDAGSAARILESWVASRNGLAADDEISVRGRAASDFSAAGLVGSAVPIWTSLLTKYPEHSDSTGWLYQRGKYFRENGNSVRALEDFHTILERKLKSTESDEAEYQTGLVYMDRKEPARAEAWFYGLVQRLGHGDLYERSLLARGVAFVNSGKTDLARGSLERLIRENPSSPWVTDAWNALGRNALQARLFSEAKLAFQNVLDRTSDPTLRTTTLEALAEVALGSHDPDLASSTFETLANLDSRRKSEFLLRTGQAYAAEGQWDKAAAQWQKGLPQLDGAGRSSVVGGIAEAQLHLGDPEQGFSLLNQVSDPTVGPDLWYRWGQTATALGYTDWATQAFEHLLTNFPDSRAAQSALPRAAGALLAGGKPEEAIARYADYFQEMGQRPEAAPVARAAAAAAAKYPDVLAALVRESQKWNLAPEVAAEWALASAQSRLDSDPDYARQELENLGKSAPWTTQQSTALLVLGRWYLSQGKLTEARAMMTSASGLGDDLTMFQARWGLAEVSERSGDLVTSARQRESFERSAGPGVPIEFRKQLLAEALALWKQLGKDADAQRVQDRLDHLAP